MQQWQRHPQVPWVIYVPAAGGGFWVRDERSDETVHAASELALHQQAAKWATAPGSAGLGDAIKAAAGALGFAQCSPCAQRQAALNRMVPRLWRR